MFGGIEEQYGKASQRIYRALSTWVSIEEAKQVRVHLLSKAVGNTTREYDSVEMAEKKRGYGVV